MLYTIPAIMNERIMKWNILGIEQHSIPGYLDCRGGIGTRHHWYWNLKNNTNIFISAILHIVFCNTRVLLKTDYIFPKFIFVSFASQCQINSLQQLYLVLANLSPSCTQWRQSESKVTHHLCTKGLASLLSVCRTNYIPSPR